METIPALFWMFIITALTLGLFLILFYIAMAIRESIDLIKETTLTVKESREILAEAKTVVSETKNIVTGVKSAVDSVIDPLKKLGAMFGFVSSMVPSAKNNK